MSFLGSLAGGVRGGHSDRCNSESRKNILIIARLKEGSCGSLKYVLQGLIQGFSLGGGGGILASDSILGQDIGICVFVYFVAIFVVVFVLFAFHTLRNCGRADIKVV